ncbi:MAG: glycoside hydrolase family 44 protein [Capsulimonas sp.]|uniref:glycoside hydrolase family 44 protein n=1 Tax=Capsulimonas sp. TaxID=2494211 RepID=UPI003265F147
MKKRARIAYALGAILLAGGVYGVRHRHQIRETLRDWYHQYKDSKTQAVLAAYEVRERADEPLVIYDDGLKNGWQDWSWMKRDLHSTQNVYSGASAILLEPKPWKGLYLQHSAIGLLGYGTVELYVHGNAPLDLCIVDGRSKFGKKLPLEKYCQPAGNGWSVARIPMRDFDLPAHGARMSGLVIQARGEEIPPLSVDQISLLPDLSLPPAPTEATVAATVDLTADHHPISPMIYGMAFASPAYLSDLRLGINRWGGNDKSRYNWAQGNAVNAARDWGWRNRWATGDKSLIGPSSAADAFIKANLAASTQTMLTVPTIGWVAADSNTSHYSLNVPKAGGSPLQEGFADGPIAGYDPAGNRQLTSVPSKARKGAPFADPPSAVGPVFQDEWISHLKRTFGDASHSGVRYYAMDNEPDLWDATHTDVHPARMGYDDIVKNFTEYADAVKDVDPAAQITGPVSWGWTGYQYSPLDRGDDNFHTHADRNAHGDQPFLPWFLKQVRAHDQQTGRRSLDVLDIHYYPQGSGLYMGGGTDKDTRARRLRSVRSLWDPTYTDESWIAEKITLIPRMKQWAAENYPGTKIGLTEWNFGSAQTINGGLAVTDALGVFGREGLDMACYWAYPTDQSAGYLAFKLYRNPDGFGHGFGDMSVRAASANGDQMSVYAAIDSATGDATVMLVNKMPKATVTAPVQFAGLASGTHTMRRWRVIPLPKPPPPGPGATGAELWAYRHQPDPVALETLPSQIIPGGRCQVTLPPYSSLLLRVSRGAK